jgi:hypothetical protein
LPASHSTLVVCSAANRFVRQQQRDEIMWHVSVFVNIFLRNFLKRFVLNFIQNDLTKPSLPPPLLHPHHNHFSARYLRVSLRVLRREPNYSKASFNLASALQK